jgi:biopolymer transport protein TolQ
MPGPVLADVDLVPLLMASKGIVLFVVIILLLLVALCVFVVFYKIVHISQAQAQSITFLDRFWESKRLDEIYGVAEKLKRSPIAAMFRAGYVELSKVKRSRDSQQQSYGMDATVSMHDRAGDADNVERALARARLSENTKLENLLPFLATTGSAAPFIGLFGTVWGIMDAFLNIAASGSADLGSVSQPIAEALVTTALALASAVPAVVAYNYFQRRLKVLNAEMSTFGNDYLNIIRRHFF